MRDIVISIVAKLRNGSWGFESRQRQGILFYSKTSISALGPPKFLLNVCRTFYAQKPGRDANHSPPASAKFQNDGKYTSIPPVYFRAVYRTTYPLHVFVILL
jgi:hypothetical protein